MCIMDSLSLLLSVTVMTLVPGIASVAVVVASAAPLLVRNL